MRNVILALAVALGVPAAASPREAFVDWPAFLSRHDLVWKRVPARWEEGAWLGNGLLGVMVYSDAKNGLSWQLGRTDVTEHGKRADPLLARARLPIGRLVLETAGEIRGMEARLDLWNAELLGTLQTDRGSLRFRSFIHAEEPLLLIDLEATGDESAARFAFRPDLAIVERLLVRSLPITAEDLNPPPFVEEHGPVRVSVQPRRSGGEHAVAWQEAALGEGRRRLVLSIADSYPDAGARRRAVEAVQRGASTDIDRLRASHQAFWHAYYPASFVSLPDTRLESFYWIQMYKLAAATRADRPAIDTLGPWYHTTPWPGVWWNLNIQLSYWPVYAGNRLSLGESLLRIVDRNVENLRGNVPEAWRADSMAVGRMGGPEAISPVSYVGPFGPKNGAHEMSNLVWVTHNYWLHWRHTMDDALLRERLYPLLRASVSYLLHRLERGADGKLHLPEAVSPEYPQTAPDTNYDLSLLRWGLQTLIGLCGRLGTHDPLLPTWRRTLDELTPYPEGPTGYLIGAGQPLAESHRHFSHLLMVYPLHLVTAERPEDRARIERSLAHWIGFEGALQGYSFVGASAISSLLGKGDDAVRYLDELIGRFVLPNTMYREAGPVIETPLSAAQAVHDMLLQSWGDTLRVFPAVPSSWPDVAYGDLRAQGAFLVSAVRRDGRTVCVKVTSLAGEAARLEIAERDELVAPGQKRLGKNAWRLRLAKGQSLLVSRRGAAGEECRPAPVAEQPGRANAFGLR
jgi:alpha-L-fucosidase 2